MYPKSIMPLNLKHHYCQQLIADHVSPLYTSIGAAAPLLHMKTATHGTGPESHPGCFCLRSRRHNVKIDRQGTVLPVG